MTITPQNIITAGAVLTAALAILKLLTKTYDWFLNQKAQDGAIAKLRKTHEDDIKALKHEQAIIVYGMLACLKGLREQGCNGPVTEAIATLEKHLNKEAHK